ncbi:MAG: DUF4382 domain-containing protein [Fimbriimonadaceae bacterium]|nr:DUF4382 domain-containing protein [Fimbriimonadaceae bacterium]
MKKLLGYIALLMALIIAGCGGGGSGSSGGAGSNVGLFFTDDLNAGYDHVWVKVEKVELLSSSGSVTVFEDSAGTALDLRALNDSGTNKFFFANRHSIPQGSYTGIRVTMDDALTIFPTGSATGNARVFSGLNGNSKKVLTHNFSVAKTFGIGLTYQVLDFKLDTWSENGGNVDVSGSGLDDFPATNPAFTNGNNHHDKDYKGTISALAAGSFKLNRPRGQLEVTFDSGTNIYNESGAPNPTLANGKKVEVRGVFNPSTGKLAAMTIKIDDDNNNDDEDEAKGLASDLNLGARTFTLTFSQTEGFIPSGTTTTVTLTENARLFSHRGLALTRAEFYAALDALPSNRRYVEVEGTYDGANFSAFKAKIEDDDDDDDEVEARGAPSAQNSIAGTFNLTLTEWEGFNGSNGMVIGVETNGSTKFRDQNGETITKTQFFASMPGFHVKVEGYLEGNVILAKQARLRSQNSGGGGNAEAEGSVSDINSVGQSFKLSLTGWSGFGGLLGQVITVNTNGATYRDDDGNTINSTQFYAALSNGSKVEVEGHYSLGVMTATKAKLDDD